MMKVPTNKIKDVLKYYTNLLNANFRNEESKSLIYQLFLHFFGVEKIDFIKDTEKRLSESELLKIHFAVKDLLTNKPIQYIIGETVFKGLKLRVDSNVLIPRPETEELVEILLARENLSDSKKKILDIGSGSGCIGISIKKEHPASEVLGIDISFRAIQIAKENAALNQCAVDFVETDFMDEDVWNDLGMFDIIISNPPYVRESEKRLMQKNVLDYEPEKALFVPDSDPLLFYEKISRFGKTHLASNGVLYFEINEAFGVELKELLKRLKYRSIVIVQDVYGKDRFIRALK